MKSKLVLFSLLVAAFSADAALNPTVKVGVFGGVSHSGLKFKNPSAVEAVSDDKKDEKEDDKDSKDDKDADKHTKAGFAGGASVGVSFKKDNLSFGLEGGLMFNVAKYGDKDFVKSDEAKEVEDLAKEAKAAFNGEQAKALLGLVEEGDLAAVKRLEDRPNPEQAEVLKKAVKFLEGKAVKPAKKADAKEKDSKDESEDDNKSSLVSNNGMLFFFGPTAGIQFSDKMSAELALDCVFSSVTIEPSKDLTEIAKFEKTFFGFGPKVSFSYDITSNISAFAFAGYFMFPEKKYDEKDDKKADDKKEDAKKALEVQHCNMFVGGLGVSFKLNG